MERKIKEWTRSYNIAYRSILILMLSGFPFLLASCTDGLINNQKTPYSGPKVAVQFSFGGVVDKGSEVVTRSGAGVSEEETVVIPLADDLYMYATLEVDQAAKTRAASSNLEPGTKVRVVAYLNGDTYHTHADYTVSNSQELTGDLLGVEPGEYKFVAYSYNTTTLPNHDFTTDLVQEEILPSTDLLWGYAPADGTYTVVSSSREEVPITMSHMFSQVKIQATTTAIPGNIPIEAIGGVSLAPGKAVYLKVKDAIFTEAGDFIQPFSSIWDGTGTTTVISKLQIVNTNGSAHTDVTIGSVKLQSVDTAFTNRKATFVKQLQRGVSYTLLVNFRSSFEETIIVTPSYIELSFDRMDPAPQTLTVTPMKGPNIDPTRAWTLTTPTSSWLWLTLNANGTGGGTTLNGTGQQTVYLRPGQNSGNAPRYVNISLDDKKNPVKVVTNVKQNYFEAIGETGTGIERIYIEDNGYNPKLLLTKNNSNPGAFFQFGGIRGWKQPSGNITNIPAAYNPSHIGSGWSSGWTPVGYNAGYVVTHTLESLRAGTGDPCRLVGYTKSEIEAAIHRDNPNAYAPDNKVWRLPIGGQLQGFATNSETFPRFGYIYSETNNYLDNGTMGYYWGSWQSAGGATYTNAGLLRSSSTGSSGKVMWSLPPASAMSIRCVNQ